MEKNWDSRGQSSNWTLPPMASWLSELFLVLDVTYKETVWEKMLNWMHLSAALFLFCFWAKLVCVYCVEFLTQQLNQVCWAGNMDVELFMLQLHSLATKECHRFKDFSSSEWSIFWNLGCSPDGLWIALRVLLPFPWKIAHIHSFPSLGLISFPSVQTDGFLVGWLVSSVVHTHSNLLIYLYCCLLNVLSHFL